MSYFGLLGYNSLTKDKLNSLLTRFWLNKTSYYFDETLYNSFQRYLKPPIHQIEEGINIIYSKEQQELIRSEIRPRRKIKGVAGSGKTFTLVKEYLKVLLNSEDIFFIAKSCGAIMPSTAAP